MNNQIWAAQAVNTVLVDTYWQVGRYIVEYEQQGKERAEYGSNLLNRLSADLTRLYGTGVSKSNLLYNYFEILKANDSLEISFYTKECEKEHWSVRELKN